MGRKLLHCLLFCAAVSSCAPSFKGVFDGSGQIGTERFFSLTLDTVKQTVIWQESDIGQEILAMCDVIENEAIVSFSVDLDTKAAVCSEMKSTYRFQGTFGRDVVAGEISDPNGRVVGRFRALRRYE